MAGNRGSLDLQSIARLAELGDYTVPLALRAVNDLGVADLLAEGPRRVADIADEVGAHAPTLLRALRALAAKGVFTEIEPETFGLTPLAEPLRSDHPLSLRGAYPFVRPELQAWACFDHALRTGEVAFAQAHGCDYWDFLAAHPDRSAEADRCQRSANRLHLRTVLPAYPWAELSSLVDVGGGSGAFLAGLLARHRSMRGVLVDLPHVVDTAPEVLAAAGVADRCEVVAGSFFAPLPAGADGYLLKTVLPGFPDAQVLTILRRVREAMAPESRLLLLEAVLPEGDTFDVAKLVDIHMLVLTGCAHRPVTATAELLAQAGLRLRQVRSTATLTILDARPAPPAG